MHTMSAPVLARIICVDGTRIDCTMHWSATVLRTPQYYMAGCAGQNFIVEIRGSGTKRHQNLNLIF